MSDCVFCDLLAGNLPMSQVYRDAVCTAMLDIQPVNPGHLLVIPNIHAATLAELDVETGAQMFRVAQRLAQALRRFSRPSSCVSPLFRGRFWAEVWAGVLHPTGAQ